MRRELVIPVAIGVLIVTVALAVALWVNRGSHLVLEVNIQKVRTQAIEEQASVLVLDVRLLNPADYPYVVRKVDVILDIGEKIAEGFLVADVDSRRLMEYYPALSPKYNDTLKMRDRIQPKQTVDRMVAMRYELPESVVVGRKGLTLRIEEIDGQVTEIKEQKRK